MANKVEALKSWEESVDRVKLSAATLQAAIKMFESGGPDAEIAWQAVESAREVWRAAVTTEGKRYRSVTNIEPGDQTEMDGMESPNAPKGPKSGGGPKGMVPPPKQLGPKSAES